MFLATTSPKIDFKNNFSINFREKISQFSQQFVFVVQKREKLKQLLKLSEKWPEIMHFCNFLKQFVANFSNLPASWGSAPGHHEADPIKCPPNRNPGGAAGEGVFIKMALKWLCKFRFIRFSISLFSGRATFGEREAGEGIKKVSSKNH